MAGAQGKDPVEPSSEGRNCLPGGILLNYGQAPWPGVDETT